MKREIETSLLPDEIQIVRSIAIDMGVTAFLVGGAVRDIVMGVSPHDYDFALTDRATGVARKFAAASGGKFFFLDEERQQSRVVIKESGSRIYYDFAPLRGRNVREDLMLRDFTINSMSIDLTSGHFTLLDPLNGLRDIHDRLVRVSSRNSFRDDPLRLLRAFRFSAVLGAAIEPGTMEVLRRDATLLSSVAGERIRDEFFAILRTAAGGRMMGEMVAAGVLDILFPGLPEGFSLEKTLAAVEEMEDICSGWTSADMVGTCLARYLSHEIQEGIPVSSLLKLATLLKVNSVNFSDSGRRFRLGSNAERIITVLLQEYVAPVAKLGHAPKARMMYRFFSDIKGGPEVVLMAAFDGILARKTAEKLLAFFFNSFHSQIELVTGYDVMRMTGLTEGREIGEALEEVRKAERLGLLESTEEALLFLRKKLLTKGTS